MTHSLAYHTMPVAMSKKYARKKEACPQLPQFFPPKYSVSVWVHHCQADRVQYHHEEKKA